MPDKIKIVKVISVYTYKSTDYCSNYRPISLLPSIDKISGKIVYRRTYDFIQYITAFTSDVVNALEKRPILSVFLDLSKPFHIINHHILLYKLEYYGIRSILLKWLKSYPSNRKQYVKYNNSDSRQQDATHGVPQVRFCLFYILMTFHSV